jgi:UDP-N-acetylmuramyl-tripeptide synthetase
MLLGDLIATFGLGVWMGDRCAPITTPESLLRVCDITEDSRTIMPGSMFIARKGAKADGHDFVLAAARAQACCILSDQPRLAAQHLSASPELGRKCIILGILPDAHTSLPQAVAKLAERFYGSHSSKLALIGVTGTKGKTTTTWLIHDMLNRRDRALANGESTHIRKCGLIGTVVIDDGVEVAPAMLTTPPALEVSRTMRRMVEAGCQACAMEVSSHALDQHRATGINYRLAIFTNLGHDHLDYHGTMERYAQAKAALFKLVPASGCAIVNGQDPWSKVMLEQATCRILRCGVVKTRQEATTFDLAAIITGEGDLDGTQITILRGAQSSTLRLPLIGEHNVMNALQAAASIMELGASFDETTRLLSSVRCPPGRMERVEPSPASRNQTADLPAVYVDYAHTPESLQAVLELSQSVVAASNRKSASEPAHRPGRVICVFGCGGDRDTTKRPKMGLIAQELCTATSNVPAGLVIITSDNPRSEDPATIAHAILAGMQNAESLTGQPTVMIELDRAAAIRQAINLSHSGDLVLIAGKGHEDYQIVRDGTLTPDGKPGTIKRVFDDRIEARKALDAKSLAKSAHAHGART